MYVSLVTHKFDLVLQITSFLVNIRETTVYSATPDTRQTLDRPIRFLYMKY